MNTIITPLSELRSALVAAEYLEALGAEVTIHLEENGNIVVEGWQEAPIQTEE